jgi:hypothetical protein
VASAAANTEAGIALVQKLSDIKRLDLLNKRSIPDLRELLNRAMAESSENAASLDAGSHHRPGMAGWFRHSFANVIQLFDSSRRSGYEIPSRPDYSVSQRRAIRVRAPNDG